jgi:hypothetical protein
LETLTGNKILNYATLIIINNLGEELMTLFSFKCFSLKDKLARNIDEFRSYEKFSHSTVERLNANICNNEKNCQPYGQMKKTERIL